MENPGIEISSVDLSNEQIKITYENNAIEILPVNHDTFHLMYNTWIVPNPPFISDRYKIQMKDLSLCCIANKEDCKSNLHKFFVPSNEKNVKEFLTYMRKRADILPAERSKWTKK